MVLRRFLVASAFARLILRERGISTRIIEGYFPPKPDRTQYVRVERDECYLVLGTRGPDGASQTDALPVPLSHADALVSVAPGRLAFDRTTLALGFGAEGLLDRFIVPNGLDVVSVTISGDPRFFVPPLWFGREVTDDPRFDGSYLALNGAPVLDPGEVSNNALEALLDWLDGLYASRATHSHTSTPAQATDTATLLDHLIVAGPDAEALEPCEVESTPATHEDGGNSEEDSEGDGGNTEERGKGGAFRRPILLGDVPELEPDTARLARSLAPKRFRSLAE